MGKKTCYLKDEKTGKFMGSQAGCTSKIGSSSIKDKNKNIIDGKSKGPKGNIVAKPKLKTGKGNIREENKLMADDKPKMSTEKGDSNRKEETNGKTEYRFKAPYGNKPVREKPLSPEEKKQLKEVGKKLDELKQKPKIYEIILPQVVTGPRG
ncbi:MAG: hypothetical protein H7843_09285 [Nitrospirota bacterium]